MERKSEVNRSGRIAGQSASKGEAVNRIGRDPTVTAPAIAPQGVRLFHQPEARSTFPASGKALAAGKTACCRSICTVPLVHQNNLVFLPFHPGLQGPLDRSATRPTVRSELFVEN
jgi:hypothetical protein